MGKTAKNTQGQDIVIIEFYPDDLAGTVPEQEIDLLKDKYGDKPCAYEIHFPWKPHPHIAWFVDDVYEKYSNTHVIVHKKQSG